MPSDESNYWDRHMADILKPAHTEHFMVDIFEVSKEDVDRVRLRDLFNGRGEYSRFTEGKYARLCHRNPDGSRGPTIMSDTWMEKQTNLDLIRNAKGDVLIAGLGMGMVLMELQSMPEVRTITVVEKEAEVIEMVRPQLPLNEKVIIVNQDIFDYKPEKKFDTIYFDIWDDICGDNYPQMTKLQRKFARVLNPDGWMTSWRKGDSRRSFQGR